MQTFEITGSKDSFLAQMFRTKNGWGKRRLNRFKTVNGKRFQLHATRGWKAV
ncbi:MAG: hypothetical protein Unbinned3138contig1000_9 [Prokaryotic dsDNA virus sp.]|nr:MAG: hypothetical protein Unbinned3138contig1000_9 [Prokaryotic dsDNA virus sp.]|tara:strand:+ start:1560 stop:1715 length:156 start_codon:yes stop_codon:yes gene_type:complete